jgi:3(or 17)beta-hydroxysteroid dehydrogenase
MAAAAARVAFITGAAQGIGRATANKLASRGISIVLADQNEDRGHAAAKDVASQFGVKTKFVKVDVTQEQQVKDGIGEALKLTGRLDYAANCAGICESVWEGEEDVTVELYDKYDASDTACKPTG